MATRLDLRTHEPPNPPPFPTTRTSMTLGCRTRPRRYCGMPPHAARLGSDIDTVAGTRAFPFRALISYEAGRKHLLNAIPIHCSIGKS